MRRHSRRADLRPETAWYDGRLSWCSPRHRLLFGRMYEDAQIEQEAFRGKGRVFCIASAGDTALLLAGQHEVVACDINPTQLAYAQRRASGVPAESGDAERAMSFLRSFMPLAGWRKNMLRAFLDLSDVGEQMAFWREHLDTRRFRAGFDTLISRPILHAISPPRFLSSLPSKFGAVLRKRLERGFARHPNASNPYARALLLGETRDDRQQAAPSIRFVSADAASWLETCPAGSFDGFALSNILDGAGPAYLSRLSQAVRRAATEAAVVVLRSFAEPPPGLGGNHAECDRAMLWGVVEIRSAQTF